MQPNNQNKPPKLDHISPELVKKYQDQITVIHTPSTTKRKLASLRRFFDWAEKKGHVRQSPLKEKPVKHATTTPQQSPPPPPGTMWQQPQAPGGTGFKLDKDKAIKIGAAAGAGVAILLLLIFLTRLFPGARTPFVAQRERDLVPQEVTQATPSPTPQPTPGTTPRPISTDSGQPTVPGTTPPSNIQLPDNLTLVPGATVSADILRGRMLDLYGTSPTIQALEAPLLVKSTGMTFQTLPGSDGDITIAPDGEGQVLFRSSTTSDSSIDIRNANLTTGDLISGNVGNTGTAYNFIRFTGGPSEVLRFSIDASGSAYLAGNLDVQGAATISGELTAKNGINISSGDLKFGGTTYFTSLGRLTNITGYKQTSGLFEITQGAPDYAKITKTGVSATADNLIITLDETGKTTSTYSALKLVRKGTSVGKGYALNIEEGDAFIGGYLIVEAGKTLQVGGATPGLAYNAIAHAGEAPEQAEIASDNDLYIGGDLEVDGTIFGNLSGAIDVGFSQGSVVFANADGELTEDNANFFWDDTNNKLGIGTNSPTGKLDVTGAVVGKALVILSETGDQDILTASSGATPSTVFRITNAGNVYLTGTLNTVSGNLTIDSAGGQTTVSDNFVVTGTSDLQGNVSNSTGTLTLDDDVTISGTLGVTGATTLSSTLSVTGATTLSSTLAVTGDTTLTGDLAVNGGDVTSTGDLTINPAGGDVFLADGDVIVIGGHAGGVGYNVIANAGEAPENAAIASDNDLYIGGDLEVDGSIFGTINPGLTAGSVVFADASGNLTEDNANFFWDDTNNKLGIGTNSPAGKLHVTGAVVGKALVIFNETGDQNILTASASGTTVANLDRSGNLAIEGAISDLSGTTLVVDDDLQINGNDLLSSTGTTAITLSGANVTVAGNLSVNGNTTLGDASGDTVTANADSWTFANDTNFVLSGGVNGLSFDTDTLSIDALNNRVGIGTTSPTDSLTIGSGGLAFTAGSTQVISSTTSLAIRIDSDNNSTAENLVIQNNLGAELFRFTEGGNLGIGDTSPTSLLTVGSGDLFQVDSTGSIVSIDGVAHSLSDTSGDLEINSAGGDLLVNDRVTIGSATAGVGKLTVTGAEVGKALVILNETGDQNILTASNSGTTVANLTRTGNLELRSSVANADRLTIAPHNAGAGTFTGTITSANLTADRTWTFPDETGTVCLSTDNCGATATVKWSNITNPDANLTLNHSTFTTIFNSDVTTDTFFTINGNSLTTGTLFALSSTSTSFNGELFTLSKTGASGSTAFTSDIANITYSQTFNGGVGLDSTGNILDISRSITLNNAGNTHTVSGPVVTISDSGTQTAGTLTHTGNVLSLTQNYSSSTGNVLSISNAGTGNAIEIAGAGTRSINSTSSDLTIQTTTSGNITVNSAGGTTTVDDNLSITGNTTIGDASTDTVTVNSNSWTFANDTNFVLSGGVNGLSFDTDTLSIDASNDKVGIGSTSPDAKLHVTGASVGKALVILNETGDQNILTASASGTTVANITRDGNLELRSDESTADRFTLAPSSAAGSTFTGTLTTANLTAGRTWTLVDETGTICLDTGNCGAGGVAPDSLDYTEFKDAMALDATTSVAFSTFNYVFNLDSTGDFIIQDAGTARFTFNDSGSLDVASGVYIGLGSAAGRIEFDDQATDEVNILDANVGIGTSTPTGKLHVSGAVVGKALAIFNETGDQNILTASNSGTTVLNLTRTGNIELRSSVANADRFTIAPYNAGSATFTGTLTSADLTADRTWTFPNEAGDVCLTSSNCGAGAVGPDSLDYTEFKDAMALDATTSVAFGAFNYVFNLDSTGDFIIQDAGVNTHIFDDSGNVGFGTTTPDRRLDVLHTTSPQLRLTQSDNVIYADFQVNSSGDLLINIDGQTNQLVLDNGGSVGIGTVSPGAKLQVSQTDAANDEAILIDTEETTNSQDVFRIISDYFADETQVFNVDADGSTTIGASAGNDKLRASLTVHGDSTVKGKIDIESLTQIVDIYVYDTTKDSDGGKWRNDERAKASSWYNETIDAVGASCTIDTNDRCGAREFPEKVILIASTTKLYIFDAKDNTLWMEFRKGSATTQRMIGPTTNSTGSSVFALNGKIYYGSNGTTGGLYVVDFIKDRGYRYNATDDYISDQNVGNRNSTVTWATGPSGAIVDNAVNDVHVRRMISPSSASGKTFVATGTDAGVSVINEVDRQVFDYTDNAGDDYNAVWLDLRGDLWALNETTATLEKWASVITDTADESPGTPDSTWDETTTPALTSSAPTIAASAPDALYVTDGTSTVDGTSPTVFVGTNLGLTALQTKRGDEANGSVKYYTSTFISEEMVGDVRGMWDLSQASTVSNGTSIDDVSVNDADLTAVADAGGITVASGVRGKGLTGDGTNDYLRQEQTSATYVSHTDGAGNDTITLSGDQSAFGSAGTPRQYWVFVDAATTDGWGYLGTCTFTTNTACNVHSARTGGTQDFIVAPVGAVSSTVIYESEFQITGAFTLSAWVSISTMPSTGEQDAIIAKWDQTNTQRAFRLIVENDDADTTGNFQVDVYDESADQTITAETALDTVSTSTWYHVVATFNGGTSGTADDLKLYVDGVFVDGNAANASFAGIEDVNAEFTIANYDPDDAVATNTIFTGTFDEPYITAETLTATQVREIHEVGKRARENHTASRITGVTGADNYQRLLGNASGGVSSTDRVMAVTVDDANQFIYAGLNDSSANTGGVTVIGVDSDSAVDLYDATANTGKDDDAGSQFAGSDVVAISVTGTPVHAYNSGTSTTGASAVLAIAGTNDTTTSSWMESSDLSLYSTLASLSSPGLTRNTVTVTNIFRVFNSYNNLSDSTSGERIETAAFQVDQYGNFVAQSLVDSTTAMQFKNSSGTTVLDVDTTNSRVGIGTTSPGAKLHVLHTAEQLRLGYDATFYASFTVDSGGDLTINAQGGGTQIGTGTPTGLDMAGGDLYVTGDLEYDGTLYTPLTAGSVTFIGASGQLTQDNTNFFWDDTNNRLGLGNNSPTARLDVTGDASTSGSLVFRGTSPVTIDVLNGARLDFQTSPGGDAGLTARATLLSNGNFGLGTTAPGQDVAGGTSDLSGSPTLHVKSSSADAEVAVEGNTGAFLTMIDLGGALNDKVLQYEVDGGIGVFRSLNDALTTNQDNILVMDLGNANVGLGTNAPSAKLHVAMDTGSVPAIGASTGVIVSNTSATTDAVQLSLIAGNAASSQINFGDTDDEDIGRISYDHTSNFLAFYTSATEKLRLDTNGHITWSAATPTLTITNGETITINDGTNTLFTLADGGIIGNGTFTGDLAVNGGDITTTTTGTATLFNTNATTLNMGGAATTVSIGAATGTLTVNNAAFVAAGTVQVNGEEILNESGTAQIRFCNLAACSVSENRQTKLLNASLFVENTVNVGKAALILQNLKGTNLISASNSAGTTVFQVEIDGDVVVGSGGGGKITVATIDPQYVIGGETYATYVPSMVGIKEEVAGTVTLQPTSNSSVYAYVIELDKQQRGSDVWLFRQAVDLGTNMDLLSVFLSAENTKVSYKKDGTNNRLIVYGDRQAEVSFRLTAPRFDHASWGNLASDPKGGFQRPNPTDQSGSSLATDDDLATIITDTILAGDLEVNGGDIKTTASTFNLVNANAAEVNFAGAATTLNLGATSGTTTVKNNLSVSGNTTVANQLTAGSGQITNNLTAGSLNVSNTATVKDATISQALQVAGKVFVDSQGRVSIGTNSAQTVLTVAQNSSTDPIADAWTTYSSGRWKENVQSIQDALEKIDLLNPVYYTWKKEFGGKADIGFIAEQIGKVVPEVVVWEEDGVTAKGLDYSRLSALAIAGVKEQQKQISKLGQKVETQFLKATEVAIEETASIQNLLTENLTTKKLTTDNATVTEKLVSPVIETSRIETGGEDLTIDLSSPAESKFGKFIVQGDASISGDLYAENLQIGKDATVEGTLRAKRIEAEEIAGLDATFENLVASQTASKLLAFEKATSASQSLVERIRNRIEELTSRVDQFQTDESKLSLDQVRNLIAETSTPSAQLSWSASQWETQPDASVAASLAEAIDHQPTTISQNMDLTANLNVLGNLNAYGTTTLANTFVNGQVSITTQKTPDPVTGAYEQTLVLSGEGVKALGMLSLLGTGGVDIGNGALVVDVFGNVAISGNLTVDGTLRASRFGGRDGDVIFDLAQESKFGKLLVKGLDGQAVASIDASGAASFAEVKAPKFVIASSEATESAKLASGDITTNATAGRAVLPAFTKSITIYNPNVSNATLSYITPISSTGNQVLYVKSKEACGGQNTASDSASLCTPYFIVGLDRAVNADVHFNWWIIELKNN